MNMTCLFLSLKEKIWNFEYIDLSLLLKQNFVHNTQDNQNTLQIIDGKLVVQSKSKKVKSIDSIKMWTEAFITYIQVVIENHPNKAHELLKYLSVIRGASDECPTVQWVQYDQQFRLRVSRNPTRSWSNIDAELWLRFIAKGSHGQNTGQSRLSKYPCYDYNFKGQCNRQNCIYRHNCMKCSLLHPACNCFQSMGYGPPTPRFQVPQIRGNTQRPLNPNMNNNTSIRPRNFAPRR